MPRVVSRGSLEGKQRGSKVGPSSSRSAMANEAGEPAWLQTIRSSDVLRQGTLAVECGKNGVPKRLTDTDLAAIAKIIHDHELENPQISTIQLTLAGPPERTTASDKDFEKALKQLGEAIGQHTRTRLALGRPHMEALVSAISSSAELHICSIYDIEIPTLNRGRTTVSDSRDPFNRLRNALGSRPHLHNLLIGKISNNHTNSDKETTTPQQLRLVEGTCAVLQGVRGTLRKLTLQELSFEKQAKQVGHAIALCKKLRTLELRSITFSRDLDQTTQLMTDEWDDVLHKISRLPALRSIVLEKIDLNDERVAMLAYCIENRLPALHKVVFKGCFTRFAENAATFSAVAAMRCRSSGKPFKLTIDLGIEQAPPNYKKVVPEALNHLKKKLVEGGGAPADIAHPSTSENLSLCLPQWFENDECYVMFKQQLLEGFFSPIREQYTSDGVTMQEKVNASQAIEDSQTQEDLEPGGDDQSSEWNSSGETSGEEPAMDSNRKKRRRGPSSSGSRSPTGLEEAVGPEVPGSAAKVPRSGGTCSASASSDPELERKPAAASSAYDSTPFYTAEMGASDSSSSSGGGGGSSSNGGSSQNLDFAKRVQEMFEAEQERQASEHRKEKEELRRRLDQQTKKNEGLRKRMSDAVAELSALRTRLEAAEAARQQAEAARQQAEDARQQALRALDEATRLRNTLNTIKDLASTH
eukprot:tig00000076_g2343.t1